MVTPADASRAVWRMPQSLRKTARAVAEALFADETGPPPSARLTWMLDDIDDFLSRSGPRARMVFSASMLALETLAPLTIRRLPPLSRLDRSVRAEAISQFEQTPLGLAVLGAKATLCIVYYEHPDAAAEIGFDGACKDPR